MKRTILAAALFAAACGGAETQTRTAQAPALTAAQRSQIGKRCSSDVECGSALVCTALLSPDTGGECAYAVASGLDCPDGFERALTMDGNVGVPLTVGEEGDVPATGYFCVPLCTTGRDCSNGQCCLLFGAAAPGGSCTTPDPRNSYAAPLLCR
jgi:hypothetical protein